MGSATSYSLEVRIRKNRAGGGLEERVLKCCAGREGWRKAAGREEAVLKDCGEGVKAFGEGWYPGAVLATAGTPLTEKVASATGDPTGQRKSKKSSERFVLEYEYEYEAREEGHREGRGERGQEPCCSGRP